MARYSTRMTRGYVKQINDVAANFLDAVSEDIARDSDRMAPVGKTRRLSKSYGWRRDTKLKRQIGSYLRYATVVELGAPPHVILPRRPGGVLRFELDPMDGGGVVFARRVNHPGQLAQPHLRLALFTKRVYGRSFE